MNINTGKYIKGAGANADKGILTSVEEWVFSGGKETPCEIVLYVQP